MALAGKPANTVVQELIAEECPDIGAHAIRGRWAREKAMRRRRGVQ